MTETPLCPFCGRSKRVGGAWISHNNPVYLPYKGHRNERVLRVEDGVQMHALCRILYEKGNVLRDGELIKIKRRYEHE